MEGQTGYDGKVDGKFNFDKWKSSKVKAGAWQGGPESDSKYHKSYDKNYVAANAGAKPSSR